METNKQVKTAYAYLRVGTITQVMHGNVSLYKQKRTIKKYSRKNNIHLIGVYEDFPKSASDLERSGLKNMLAQIIVSPVDYILITDMDRLTRNMVDYCLLDQRLSKLGVKIKIARKGASIGNTLFETIESFNSEIVKVHQNNSNG